MRHILTAVGLCWLIGVAGTTLAGADDHTLNYNLVRLDADAVAEVPNDQMRVHMAVEHDAGNASALPPLVNADMKWALDAAKKHPKVRVRTGDYNTQPLYASNRISGWRASQALQLEGEDFAEVGALVTELQQKLQVRGMAFQPTRETRLRMEQELGKAALRAFAAKASLIAETMGAKGYEVVEITVGDSNQPVQPYMRAEGMMAMKADTAAPVAIEGGTASLTVTVSGQIQLR